MIIKIRKKDINIDVLIEDHITKIEDKIEKDCLKSLNVLETSLIERSLFPPMEEFWKDRKKIDEINEKMNSSLSSGNLAIKSLVEELDIKCPVSGTNNWTDVRQFNLMFKTQIGGRCVF